jgi:hypothetical protein
LKGEAFYSCKNASPSRFYRMARQALGISNYAKKLLEKFSLSRKAAQRR